MRDRSGEGSGERSHVGVAHREGYKGQTVPRAKGRELHSLGPS